MLLHAARTLNNALPLVSRNAGISSRKAISKKLCPAIAIISSSPFVRGFHTIGVKAADEHGLGERAFADCELNAMADLFYEHTKGDGGGIGENGTTYLTIAGVKNLLKSIGESPDENTLKKMFDKADLDGSGTLDLSEFLLASDAVLAGAPARTVLVVGGPGSGKGTLCERIVAECGVAHISGGDLLRDEVAQGTPIGKDCEEIMKRGGLVSSETVMALLRRRMRLHPGKRVLLDGFPRSLENAQDFAKSCGTPELAISLECDDTILMERILNRAQKNGSDGRADDNIHAALKRLRTFHKAQRPTLEWLRENHVPVISLDCSGNEDSVWQQLLAIGRLMRPATQLKETTIFS